MFPTLRLVGEDVLFVHWPVAPATLDSIIPDPLTVETYDDHAWVTVLAHEVTEATLDAVPVSPLPAFGEVDLRTYVQFDGDSGVLFLSCNTGQALNTLLGERTFGLPHRRADVSFDRHDGRILLRCQQADAGSAGRFDVTYQPTGDASPAAPDSLAEFLVERHTYFTPTSRDEGDPTQLTIGTIERDPWDLAPVDANVRNNTMFELIDIEPPTTAPTTHYSPRFESRFVGRETVQIA